MNQFHKLATYWLNTYLPRVHLSLPVCILLLLAGCRGDSREAGEEKGASTEIGESGPISTGANPFEQRPGEDGAYHVGPGQDIQAALELAANDPLNKIVKIHAGTYRPTAMAHALVHLNRRHDGITLETVGDVILTAANPALADKTAQSYPAIVNHVVYFGDGITSSTILKGCKITGANGFLAPEGQADEIEPSGATLPLPKGVFFHSDGGAIKVFGRSYPTIERVICSGNATVLCGGAVSVEHGGFNEQAVRFRDCVFKDNHCPGTGSAIDLLPGSAAIIENCLFVGNVSNTGMDKIKRQLGLVHKEVHGCGALTVFENSRVQVERCTFTGNWNGVDDQGQGNSYRACVFWMNTASDGSRPGLPYELDILDGSGVQKCFIHGTIDDLRRSVNPRINTFDAPDPKFDRLFRPRNHAYDGIGYRPIDNRASGRAD
jgi:hypothetical protein